jgi:4-diphosphocytidyl-2-C-methyl-D-erythritol kinase
MLVVPAYAKVNLALEVTGRRPDGWHDIASVIATIDWHDLVGIRLLCDAPTPPAMSPAPAALHVSGAFAEGIPTGPDNLALRAATLLLEIAGPRAARLRLDVNLVKQVPPAAGLGGGSADAAAVLRAGARLLATHGAPIADADLTGAAATLGSDVPAVLAGGTVFATGRGEHLRPLPTPALHLAVAVAGASSTAAA